MTKREQLFLFWTLAVLSVGGMVCWLASAGAAKGLTLAGVPVAGFMGWLLLVALGLFALLLAAATILMPLYVMAMHGLLKRLLERVEKLE